ncbi:energy-coupling factor transporter transmembrane protein EcfT [Desulfallas sp. Bu1-1]|jgi:energy-coupling factor transport system permease protein|uniref:energy-coupling factor transporter transmembrane component T family protein n=1 Tax=Desulfallas sp. Bu1-1 TaxID=2787620 RepID=UPI00189C5DBB|nr:energy-coupling factor transporter transmembrane component T [Desulfallas sp. Bu1-1]MBF7083477.1 energy-coupling factor transporter transmembrane protein EcfT [Desulfallas sp. Bu1-1]
MLNGIAMGQYLPAGSPVHRMDPRAKLIVAALATPAVLVAADPPSVVAVSAWVLLGAGLSGIRPLIYWRSLKIIWLLLLISFLVQVLFTPGDTLAAAGFLRVSRQGLVEGGWMLWRLTLLLVLASALSFTTTPLQLTAALEWILAPLTRLGLPVRELAMTVNLALRFVPTLFDEAQLLLMAQRSRGADFTRGGIRERVRGLIPFLVPLLANIFRRADELALAMEIRCYRVGAARSRMIVLRFSIVDYVAVFTGLAILATLLVCRLF